jgi:hypothetical protein
MLTSELARRLFAGLWFAVAAIVPVVFYFLVYPLTGGQTFQIMTALAPIFIAGICGLALGADILDENETKTALQAVGRGLAIGFLSYLILLITAFVSTAFYSEDFFGLIIFFGIVFLYGLLFIGWLIAAVGAAAGGLLYLFRLKASKRLNDGKG